VSNKSLSPCIPLIPAAVDPFLPSGIGRSLAGSDPVTPVALEEGNAVFYLMLPLHNQSLTNPAGMVSGFRRKYSSFLIRNFTRSDLLSL